MDTQKIDHHFLGVKPVGGTDDTPIRFTPIECNRDHCTSEERAVIDALVSYHQAQKTNHTQDAENCPRCSTKLEFDFAVNALLAARAKEEE